MKKYTETTDRDKKFQMNYKITYLVKDTTVKFLYYRKGELWYEVVGKNFVFPVPIDDTGDGTFNAEDKGMLFMRYIRKQLKEQEENAAS